MERITIQFTLFSAFYSPLISTMSGGFLEEEGLDPSWSVSPPGVTAIEALKDGSAHVVQSALSQGFTVLNKGQEPEVVHFAQVNEMDGFFITGREADPDFTWHKLEGAEVVMFKGGQPRAMFQYACHKAGIDFDKIIPICPGGAADIDRSFREGQGRYVQQQGPFPQRLQADGVGYVVAQVGPLIGPCGFSSLAAMPQWLETDMAKAFMRAYRKTRAYMNETPAAEIARAQKPYFPDIDEAVLADCIATYQGLGCWTPHPEITREAYEITLDVFEYNGLLNERYAFDRRHLVQRIAPAEDLQIAGVQYERAHTIALAVQNRFHSFDILVVGSARVRHIFEGAAVLAVLNGNGHRVVVGVEVPWESAAGFDDIDDDIGERVSVAMELFLLQRLLDEADEGLPLVDRPERAIGAEIVGRHESARAVTEAPPRMGVGQ